MTRSTCRQYDIIAVDKDESTVAPQQPIEQGQEIGQGQEVYAEQPPAEGTVESEGVEENLQQYAPPEPPPQSPADRVLEIVKRSAIPLVLVVVALLLIVVFVRVLQGFGGKKQVNLTYWMLWEDEKIYQPLIDDYQRANPNIKITMTKQTPKEYRERLENAILKGEGPDMFRFHNTWVPMLLQKAVIASVPDATVKEIKFETTFYPVVKADLFKGNAYYGIPLMFDSLGLYYNESILKAVGVGVPKTWDEIKFKAAPALTVKDTKGNIKTSGLALGTATNIEFWSDILGTLLYQNQGDPYRPEGDSAKDALLFYTQFALPPDNVWDKDSDNSILAFASGKVAMMFAPSWIALEIKAISPDLAFKIAPFPQPADHPPITWATYWVEGVSAKTTHKKEAFAFLAYLVRRENLTKLYSEQAKVRAFGAPYSRTDLAEQLKGHPYLDAIVSAGPYAKSAYLSSRTLDNGLNDRISKYYENAITSILGGSSPEGALDTVRQGIGQVLTSFSIQAAP